MKGNILDTFEEIARADDGRNLAIIGPGTELRIRQEMADRLMPQPPFETRLTVVETDYGPIRIVQLPTCPPDKIYFVDRDTATRWVKMARVGLPGSTESED